MAKVKVDAESCLARKELAFGEKEPKDEKETKLGDDKLKDDAVDKADGEKNQQSNGELSEDIDSRAGEDEPMNDENAQYLADKEEDGEPGNSQVKEKKSDPSGKAVLSDSSYQVSATKKIFYSEEVCVKIVNSASSKNLSKWLKQCGLPDRKNSHLNRKTVLSFIDSIIERKVRAPHPFVTSVTEKILSGSLDTELRGLGITLSGKFPATEKKRILREHICSLAKSLSPEKAHQTETKMSPLLEEDTNSCLSDSTPEDITVLIQIDQSRKQPEIRKRRIGFNRQTSTKHQTMSR